MIPQINMFQIILFVENQEISSDFYQQLFRTNPSLKVTGMTEFTISENLKLGLMPNEGIARILGKVIPHPADGNGIPRCELYLYVEDLELEFANAIKCGAKLVSDIQERNWGDNVCYFADPDGHIIAFAKKISNLL